MMSWKETFLWRKTLHPSCDTDSDREARERLRNAYEEFREKSADLVVMHYRKREGRYPNEEELKEPKQEYKTEILLERLRDLHADTAINLATRQFRRPSSSNESIYYYLDFGR